MQSELSEYDLLMQRLMDKVQVPGSQAQKEPVPEEAAQSLAAAHNLKCGKEYQQRPSVLRMQHYISQMKQVRVQNQYMQQEIGLIATYLGDIMAYQRDCEGELYNLKRKVAERQDDNKEKRIAELERQLAMEKAYRLQEQLAAREALHLSSYYPDQSEPQCDHHPSASSLQATDQLRASRVSELETTISCQQSANQFLKRYIELRNREIDELNDSSIYQQRTISRLTYELNEQKMEAKRFAKAFSGANIEAPSRPEVQQSEQQMHPLEEAMQMRILQLSGDVVQREKLISEKDAQIAYLRAVVEEKTDNCEALIQDCALLYREFFVLYSKHSTGQAANSNALESESLALGLKKENEVLRARVQRSEEKAAKRCRALEDYLASLKGACAKSQEQVWQLLDYIEAASAEDVGKDAYHLSRQQGSELEAYKAATLPYCFTFYITDPVVYRGAAPARSQGPQQVGKEASRRRKQG